MQRGSLRKRGATWTAYYFTDDGTRRQHSKGGFRTKAEAQAYLTEVLGRIQRREFVEPHKLTLAEYLSERWLPAQEINLRSTTYASYESIIRLHIIPHLGNVAVQDITPDHLDRLYANLLKSGRRNGPAGQGLSVKSVRHVHTVLQRALRDAVRKRLIANNPAPDSDPPKLRQAPDKDIKTWTSEEVAQFLDGMKNHPLSAAFHLAATTGMRRGEVLGVRWSDINFDTSEVSIRQTVLNVRYGITIGTPKTANSRRTIPLDPTTLDRLAEHRRDQDEVKGIMGDDYIDQDLVFTRPDGSPVHPDFMSQTFERSVKRLGLPRIRFHDLRHTYATMSLAASIQSKVVSGRLGHSNMNFTLDVYTHRVEALEREAANKVADLIYNSRKPKE